MHWFFKNISRNWMTMQSCIFLFFGSKGYCLYLLLSPKYIRVNRDVFVEDAVQSLLSCTKSHLVTPKHIYDNLLPLFSVDNLDVAISSHNQVSNDDVDHSIFDADMQKENRKRTNRHEGGKNHAQMADADLAR